MGVKKARSRGQQAENRVDSSSGNANEEHLLVARVTTLIFHFLFPPKWKFVSFSQKISIYFNRILLNVNRTRGIENKIWFLYFLGGRLLFEMRWVFRISEKKIFFLPVICTMEESNCLPGCEYKIVWESVNGMELLFKPSYTVWDQRSLVRHVADCCCWRVGDAQQFCAWRSNDWNRRFLINGEHESGG